ncbi:MAG: CpXC domain-containing protein [Bacteroidales bacterium]|nr:CpXC domain-containing protein [Bacteroidales bacterium]
MSSVSSPVQFKCSRCGASYEVSVYRMIDAVADPSLKEKVKDGSLFVRECPVCGQRELVGTPVIYRDAHILACLSDRKLSVEGLEGVHGRWVGDVGSLIEKVKIFDAGLDDIPMEFCKFVTRQEMGKDAELKFLRLEGADHDIIFTYPENGLMQMLSVGFNVYEDCCAIVRRNPALTAGLQGLVRIDRDWAEQFLR